MDEAIEENVPQEENKGEGIMLGPKPRVFKTSIFAPLHADFDLT